MDSSSSKIKNSMKTNIYRGEEYTAICLSNKLEKFQRIEKTLPELNLNFLSGEGCPSYSYLINQAIKNSPTEKFITFGDKAFPQLIHFEKAMRLLNDGFASVQLYCLGFCGWDKELFRIIGLFDERYIGGGLEHPDILIRMKEANIAYYESLEVPYERSPGTWPGEKAADFFHKKWISPKYEGQIDYEKRIMPEENSFFEERKSQKTFKEYKESIILTGNTSLFNRKFIK